MANPKGMTIMSKKQKKQNKISEYKKSKNKDKKKNDCSDNSEKVEFQFIDTTGLKEIMVLRKFVNWFSVIKDARRPRLHGEFAKENGVSIDTLTDWKKLKGFFDEVKLAGLVSNRNFSPEVIGGILRAAKKGNPASQKLWLQYFEGFTDKVEFEDKTPNKLTPEERKELAKALINGGLATVKQAANLIADDDSVETKKS